MGLLLLLLVSCFSHVRLCATLETATHQAPPSLGFSRQEHWSGLPFPSLILYFLAMLRGMLRLFVPRTEIEPVPPAVEARSLNHWTTREVPAHLFQMRKLRQKEERRLAEGHTATWWQNLDTACH